MRKLYEFFKVLQFQKRIVAAATRYMRKYGMFFYRTFNLLARLEAFANLSFGAKFGLFCEI